MLAIIVHKGHPKLSSLSSIIICIPPTTTISVRTCYTHRWNKYEENEQYDEIKTFHFYILEGLAFMHTPKVDMAARTIYIYFQPLSDYIMPFSCKIVKQKRDCNLAVSLTEALVLPFVPNSNTEAHAVCIETYT